MEPSTWNDKKNQHWISQFLLKGFKAKGSSSRIFRLDCVTGEIEPYRIDKVASKDHLLTNRDDALMDGIERQGSRVIDQLRKRNFGISQEQRRDLDRLVLALWANNPFHGFNKAKARRDVVEGVVQNLVDAFSPHGGVVDPAEIAPWVDQQFNEDYLSHTLETPLSTVERVLGRMTLSVCQPPEGEFFVIGDAPILMVREEVNGFLNLRNLGSQVILPVGSRCLLLYDWSPGHELVQAGPVLGNVDLGSLDDDYRYQLRCRYMYGRSQAVLERSNRLELHWQSKERPRFVSSRWAAMQLEYEAAESTLQVREIESNQRLGTIARDIVSFARQGNLTAPLV